PKAATASSMEGFLSSIQVQSTALMATKPPGNRILLTAWHVIANWWLIVIVDFGTPWILCGTRICLRISGVRAEFLGRFGVDPFEWNPVTFLARATGSFDWTHGFQGRLGGTLAYPSRRKSHWTCSPPGYESVFVRTCLSRKRCSFNPR